MGAGHKVQGSGQMASDSILKGKSKGGDFFLKPGGLEPDVIKPQLNFGFLLFFFRWCARRLQEDDRFFIHNIAFIYVEY